MYGEGVTTNLATADDQVLTVPGLYNSGPGHWQTMWEREYGFAASSSRIGIHLAAQIGSALSTRQSVHKALRSSS